MQNNMGAETALDSYRLYVDVHPLDASRILMVRMQPKNPYTASKTAYDVLVAA